MMPKEREEIMSESGDYDPGVWKGHDFTSARNSYDVHAGRSYSQALSSGKKAADLVPETIETQSTSPFLICVDVTGSMGAWPATIFSKLPYLENEGKVYLGEDLEMCFAANGDYNKNDTYPFQIRPFAKGLDLKTRLTELVVEGGGGGGGNETYELGGLYLARNVHMPRAIRKPILIIIGDEACYDMVNKAEAASINVHLKRDRISTKEIFEELKEKYVVYLIRKSYGESYGDRRNAEDQRIHEGWVELLGADHVGTLPEAERVVDVIFGIMARETDRIKYFREELEARQLPDKGGQKKVATVYRGLETIHAIPAETGNSPKAKKRHSGKSVMHQPDDGKDAKSLI
jgi:hypothetical protein